MTGHSKRREEKREREGGREGGREGERLYNHLPSRGTPQRDNPVTMSQMSHSIVQIVRQNLAWSVAASVAYEIKMLEG